MPPLSSDRSNIPHACERLVRRGFWGTGGPGLGGVGGPARAEASCGAATTGAAMADADNADCISASPKESPFKTPQ